MRNATPTRKLVVAGLITSRDGRVLITQRRADQPLPLQWEFPGGKVEPGESPQQALARELAEEIGARARIGRIWDVLHHVYDDYEVVMLVYHCELRPGQEVQPLEVRDIAWCEPGALRQYDILPADQPLIERLVGEGLPEPLGTMVDGAAAPADAAPRSRG
jgi:8-oxo-dGTP diphosphatase